MAKPPSASSAEATDSAAPKIEEREASTRQCGIIMPISAIDKYTEEYWRWVKELLHRAIKRADLQPLEVWTGSAADRITKRIIENLFSAPIAICVISGLNANVLIEVGMRLASRKPTIVVAERGLRMPFDIADFEAIFYPADLNYVGVEQFVDDLTDQLIEKLLAADNHDYKPFLGDVIIDVVEPEARQVSSNDLLERRMDELAEQLARVSSGLNRRPQRAALTGGYQISSAAFDPAASVTLKIEPDQLRRLIADLSIFFVNVHHGTYVVDDGHHAVISVEGVGSGKLRSAILDSAKRHALSMDFL